MIVLSALTVLAALAAPLLAQEASPAVNLTAPYWRRTGCYVVGHTRNITIPGCLKFTLVTNACRGYCMSYSVPVNHDLGPPSDVAELQFAGGAKDKVRTTDLDGAERLLEPEALNSTFRWTKSRTEKTAGTGTLAAMTGGTRAVSKPDLREVQSVSRCCSMVETENRVYNVRCGNNEIRRLEFKSAKSCECFFCKQA